MSLYVLIDGDPAPALRLRFTRHGRPYTPSANKAWMDLARVAYRRQHPDAPLPWFPPGTPVQVNAEFVFARPAFHWGTGRNAGLLKATAPTYHTGRPDTDNLVKLALDALTPEVVRDDGQVCAVLASKRYCDVNEVPHTELTFRPLSTPLFSGGMADASVQLSLVA